MKVQVLQTMHGTGASDPRKVGGRCQGYGPAAVDFAGSQATIHKHYTCLTELLHSLPAGACPLCGALQHGRPRHGRRGAGPRHHRCAPQQPHTARI